MSPMAKVIGLEAAKVQLQERSDEGGRAVVELTATEIHCFSCARNQICWQTLGLQHRSIGSKSVRL